MVVYGGIWWYMMVYGGIWWYMVVYGGHIVSLFTSDDCPVCFFPRGIPGNLHGLKEGLKRLDFEDVHCWSGRNWRLYIVLWLYHIISTLNLEIDGNSIFLKANARILGWMDGWMDGGWWTRLLCSWWLDSHPSYVATNKNCRFPAQRWLTLLPVPWLKSAAHGSDILGRSRSGEWPPPLWWPRGKWNDKPQRFWGYRIFGQSQ